VQAAGALAVPAELADAVYERGDAFLLAAGPAEPLRPLARARARAALRA